MRVLEYLLGVLLFLGVYALGKKMAKRSQEWEDQNQHTDTMRKTFLYGGRIFQVTGLILGLLDAVAVVVLGTALSF